MKTKSFTLLCAYAFLCSTPAVASMQKVTKNGSDLPKPDLSALIENPDEFVARQHCANIECLIRKRVKDGMPTQEIASHVTQYCDSMGHVDCEMVRRMCLANFAARLFTHTVNKYEYFDGRVFTKKELLNTSCPQQGNLENSPWFGLDIQNMATKYAERYSQYREKQAQL